MVRGWQVLSGSGDTLLLVRFQQYHLNVVKEGATG